MLLTDASRKLPGTSTENFHDGFTITKFNSPRREGGRGGHAGVQGNQKQLSTVQFLAGTHSSLNAVRSLFWGVGVGNRDDPREAVFCKLDLLITKHVDLTEIF